MSDNLLQRITQLFQKITSVEDLTKKQFVQVGNTFQQVEEAIGAKFNETNQKVGTLTIKMAGNTQLLGSYGEMIKALEQASLTNKNKINSVENSVISIVGGLEKGLNRKLDSVVQTNQQAIIDTELRLRDTSKNLILNLAAASKAKLEASNKEHIKALVDAIPPAQPGRDAFQWEFKFSDKKRSVLMFRREDWNYWEYRDLAPKIDWNQMMRFMGHGTGGGSVGGAGGRGGGVPGESDTQYNLNLIIREDGDTRMSQTETINFTGDGVTVEPGLPGKVNVHVDVPVFPGNTYNRTLAAWGSTGPISRYGVYVEQKTIDSFGSVTFYPTSNGQPTGNLLFDQITDVEVTAFLSGSVPAYELPLAVGKQINGVNSVDIVVARGKKQTTVLASIIETLQLASNVSIIVNIRVGGRMSDYGLANLDNTNLDTLIARVQSLESEVGPVATSRIDQLETRATTLETLTQNHGSRLNTVEPIVSSHTTTLASHGSRLNTVEPIVSSHTTTLASHGSRLTSLETRVDLLEGASNDRTYIAGVGGVSAYKMVCINPNGTVNHASADLLSNAYIVLGMTIGSAVAGGQVVVRKAGEVQNPLWAFISGQPVFLGTLGELTQTPPDSLKFHVPVGFAFSPADVQIRIQFPIILP